MLEQTKSRLAELPADRAELAQAMAAAMETERLREDLLAEDEARRIVTRHRAEDTEDWQRAVAAAVAGLGALDRLGYAVERR